MITAGRTPTGEEDLYSILSDAEYNQALKQVQELTQLPITMYDEGSKLSAGQIEDLRKGIELTKKLIAFQPTQFGPYFVMAKAQKALGNVDEAIRNGEQALLLVPMDAQDLETQSVVAEIAHVVSVYYYDTGKYERAEQLSDQAVQLFTTNPDYLAGAAAIKSQLGKLDDARLYVDTALAIDPKNPTALELDGELKRVGR